MLTVKPNYNRELANEVDSFFDNFFGSLNTKTETNNDTDIIKNETGYTIILDVPGFSKDDLSIQIEKDQLYIEAKKETKLSENEKFIVKRRNNLEIKKSFTLDSSIDKENITAEVKDGVLTLNAPTKPEEKPKTIEIKSA